MVLTVSLTRYVPVEHMLLMEVHHLVKHVHLVLLFLLPGLWSVLQFIRHLRLMTHHAQRMCCRVLQNLTVQYLNSLSLLPQLVVLQPAFHICHFVVLPATLVAFCSIAVCPMASIAFCPAGVCVHSLTCKLLHVRHPTFMYTRLLSSYCHVSCLSFLFEHHYMVVAYGFLPLSH